MITRRLESDRSEVFPIVLGCMRKHRMSPLTPARRILASTSPARALPRKVNSATAWNDGPRNGASRHG